MTAEIEALRRDFRKIARIETYPITCGDADGKLWDDPVNKPGFARFRFISAEGLSSGLPPVAAIGPGSGQISVGAPARLGFDYDGTPIIISPNIAAQRQAGYNLALNNPAAIPATQAAPDISTDQIVQFTSHPTTPVSAFLVIRSLKWMLGGVPQMFQASADDGSGGMVGKKDLTAYFPTAGNQCLIAYFLKPDNTVEIVASTTQTLAEPLDITDIQELYSASSKGGRAGQAWRLADGATTLTDKDYWMDLRDFINWPGPYPFTPSSTADTAGGEGDIAYDNIYLYIKTAGVGWRRIAHSTF